MHFHKKKESISPIMKASGENFCIHICVSFWLSPHIQLRLNKTGVGIEKSFMTDLKKMKNRVGNTSTKQLTLKKNFVVGAAWRKILHNIC